MSEGGAWLLPLVLPEDRGTGTGTLVLPEDLGIGTGGAARALVDLGAAVTDCCAVLALELSSNNGLATGVLCSFLSTTP